MTDVGAWLESSPFLRDLGVRWSGGELVQAADKSHTVAGGVLHGGVVASLAMVSAQAAMRAENPATRPSTISLHVSYARAGRGRSFTAMPTCVRRRRQLGFYAARVGDAEGRTVAHASATLAEGGEALEEGEGDGALEPAMSLAGDPAELDAATQAIPFLAGRGLRVAGVDRGRLEMTLVSVERNLDDDGTIHEGAVLTLIDSAGATVPWTLHQPDTIGATVALHAQILGRLPAGPLTARARVRAHSGRVSWCDVSVVDPAGNRPCALGTVAYRFT